MNSKTFLVTSILCAASAWSIAAKPISPDMLSAAERVRLVGPNTKGAAVLRVQVLLDRAHFSSGEIDAAYGQNLRKAISGFQKASGLKVTGKVDAPLGPH